MSCYLRHLRDLFEVLELEYDQVNRERVDAAVRAIVGMSEDEACPQVWAAVKALGPEEREGLSARVAEVLG